MSTVLVIDDAALMRNLLKNVLVTAGYEVCAAVSSGQEGVARYQELRPDVVLCDIAMPGMGGMECLQKLLEIDPEAKVVMCTAQGKQYFAAEAIRAGAKSFIEKPINVKNVIPVISRVLEGGSLDYKEIMMDRCLERGLDQKEVLDFFAAFRTLTGTDMGALEVDKKYLQDNRAKVEIGAEALLAAQVKLEHIHWLLEMFGKICE